MSDLHVVYTDLTHAATAMTTAASSMECALNSIDAGGKLEADAFSDKGKKFADWYDKNMTGTHAALAQSHTSFTNLATALQAAALLYKAADDAAAKKARLHHGGAH